MLKLCVFVCVQVKVPLLLVNSSDDPLVHQSLLEIPRALAGCCVSQDLFDATHECR